MFLLTCFMVGTATGKKDINTQTTNNPTEDLKVDLVTITSWGNPIGVNARVTNTGDEPITGPIEVTLKIKKGFFGFRNVLEKTLTIVEGGKTINPGNVAFSEEWYPNPSYNNGIYKFQYILNYEDENPDNNVDSCRYLILHYRMFWFGPHD